MVELQVDYNSFSMSSMVKFSHHNLCTTKASTHAELDGYLKEFVELGNPGIGNALYKALWDEKQVVFQHQCTPVIYFLDPRETCQAYEVNQEVACHYLKPS